jgi:DNA modification methylase
MGRDFVGTELNPDYADLAVRRIEDDQPMFNHVQVV